MRLDQAAAVPLVRHLRRLLELLQETEPEHDQYDVMWSGPWFVARRRLWLPSRFMIYGGQLFCWLGNDAHRQLTWRIETDEIEIDTGSAWLSPPGDECVWLRALEQIVKKLARALQNPDAYMRHVDRHLPPACRDGVVQRRLTWNKSRRTLMPARWLRELETRLDEAAEHRLLPAMTLDRYLRVTAAAYDAAFPELRGLTALEKRRRRADSRDGGMLDLPRHDPVAFATWFDSREWAGTHPWEIVFAHPHGIMLQPYRPEGEQRWGYRLWVDSLAWYVSAAEMAMALCRAKTPLVVLERDRLLATLRGEDDVRVGPDLYAVHWDDLARERPDALPHIRWNVIPHIRPITSAQRARVAHVLRTGIPPPTDLAAP